MTVDEILASGRYTDRRGRKWVRAWFGWYSAGEGYERSGSYVRLLIERDLHRDVCGELPWCDKHPVPVVIVCHETGEPWGQFKVRAHGKAEVFRTFPEAMDAARASAVGE